MTKTIQFLLLWVLFLTAIAPRRVLAQENRGQEPARLLTRFSFELLTGGVVMLRGLMDNYADTLNFILDTGSAGISIDSATCERLALVKSPSNVTIRGIGGIRNVSFARNHTLRLPSLNVDSLNFYINDYELLTNVYGVQVDGIIGYGFLSRYIVQIDYDSLKMNVFTKGDFKYPKGGHLLKPILTNLPMQLARVKEGSRDVDARFYFDTGANICFLLSEAFVRDSAFFQPGKKMYGTQAEGFGGSAPMLLTTMKEMRLGPYRFKNVPVHVFNDEMNITAYPYLGGLIGNELLRRFNVVLNYEKREIHLLPNTHFREAFDYSYTGLGMYYSGRIIEVFDIMPGSPAEKAGFKLGDQVISVGTNGTNNLQAYKDLLQNVGEKVHIIVMRNGQPVSLYLKVKSIMDKR